MGVKESPERPIKKEGSEESDGNFSEQFERTSNDISLDLY